MNNNGKTRSYRNFNLRFFERLAVKGGFNIVGFEKFLCQEWASN